MVKRHGVEILLTAGHPKTEVARLDGVSLCSAKRILYFLGRVTLRQQRSSQQAGASCNSASPSNSSH